MKPYLRVFFNDWTVGLTWGKDRRTLLRHWRYVCLHLGPVEIGLEQEIPLM